MGMRGGPGIGLPPRRGGDDRHAMLAAAAAPQGLRDRLASGGRARAAVPTATDSVKLRR